MSRLVALLEERAAPGAEPIGVASLRALLDALVARLDAPGGRLELAFPFFVRKTAPVSGIASLLDYQAQLVGELDARPLSRRRSRVAVPVTSLCPSLEGDLGIRRAQPALGDHDRGAHARADVHRRALAHRRGGGVARAVRHPEARRREVRHRARVRQSALRRGPGARRGGSSTPTRASRPSSSRRRTSSRSTTTPPTRASRADSSAYGRARGAKARGERASLSGAQSLLGPLASRRPSRRETARCRQPRLESAPPMFAALKARYDAFSERVLASLSEIEREDVKSFDRWFYGSGGWRWLVGIIAATTFFAWIASNFPWNMSFLEAAVLFNVVMLMLLWAGLTAWFGYRSSAASSSATSCSAPLLALVGAFVGAGVAGLVKGVDPLAWLQDSAKVRHVVIAGLVFGTLYLARRRADRRICATASTRRSPRISRRSARQSDTVAPARRVEAALLQLQIEPHFLFNTLGSAQQLAERGAPEAARLISNLIRFLRAATPSMRNEATTLAPGSRADRGLPRDHEAPPRQAPRLRRVESRTSCRARALPPGMLITLVENAIKHGIELSPRRRPHRRSRRARRRRHARADGRRHRRRARRRLAARAGHRACEHPRAARAAVRRGGDARARRATSRAASVARIALARRASARAALRAFPLREVSRDDRVPPR